MRQPRKPETRPSRFVRTATLVASVLTGLGGGCIDVDAWFPEKVDYTELDAGDWDVMRPGVPEEELPADASQQDASAADGRAGPEIEGALDAFNVSSAQSTSTTSIVIAFTAPPNPAEAQVASNYEVPGLTLIDGPTLDGNSVTFRTGTQSASTYTVTVSGVTRAADAEPLFEAKASFMGRAPFNLLSAESANAVFVTLRFDAEPNSIQAKTLSSYDVPGLTLQSATILLDSTVVLKTSPQSSQSYAVKVAGVTRASDGEPLTVASATFVGKSGFNVVSAQSTGNRSMTVTFDAPPNPVEATALANYSVQGLGLSAPALAGNVVTFATTRQAAQSYQVMVFDVTRASDGEPLSNTDVTFEGTPERNP